MCERKTWGKDEDKSLAKIQKENELKKGEAKLKWGQIAELLNQKTGNSRSGKQCRERWCNQLRPGISRDKEWSVEEEDILFRQQDKYGNRWAVIAQRIAGRTDNNIKNYFYSTLRKAMRKINSYVVCHKRQPKYKNVKEFKQQTLNKILTVAQNKYQNKMRVKGPRVEEDAREIKNLLILLQRDRDIIISKENNQQVQDIIQKIQDFNRNCKKKKQKKKEQGGVKVQQEQDQYEYIEGESVQEKMEDVPNMPKIYYVNKNKRQKQRIEFQEDSEEKDHYEVKLSPQKPVKIQSRGSVKSNSQNQHFFSSSSGNFHSRDLSIKSSFKECKGEDFLFKGESPLYGNNQTPTFEIATRDPQNFFTVQSRQYGLDHTTIDNQQKQKLADFIGGMPSLDRKSSYNSKFSFGSNKHELPFFFKQESSAGPQMMQGSNLYTGNQMHVHNMFETSGAFKPEDKNFYTMLTHSMNFNPEKSANFISQLQKKSSLPGRSYDEQDEEEDIQKIDSKQLSAKKEKKQPKQDK